MPASVQEFKNTILTQIAVKRLSGKAQTSGLKALAEEPYGSTVQTLNSTIFGQPIPNNPSQTEWLIQSASEGSDGTVQYIEFDLAVMPVGTYSGTSNTDAGASDDIAEDDNDVSFNHAYALKLPGDFEDNAGDYDLHAGTSLSVGSEHFTNGYHITGSRGKLQIVPSYASNIVVNNPYNPTVLDQLGNPISSTGPQDWYLDPYAGILFVQDPTTANIPTTLKAFLYIGKYQDEIAGGDADVSLHFSASQGDGFSITNNATASFETGSTSGGGLTIQANGNNSLSFTLNGVISSSAQFEGPTTINITASYAEESVEVKITDVQDIDFHPIVFTKDTLSNTPTNGATSFEELAISNDGNQNNYGFFYKPSTATIIISDLDNSSVALQPTQLTSDEGTFNILSSVDTINIGGPGTEDVRIGNDDNASTTTTIRGSLTTNYEGTGNVLEINSWNNTTQTLASSSFTSHIKFDLIHEDTGSFTISNISESTERTPLVIDNNGKVTKADSDFAIYIVGEGGGLDSMNIEEGSAQGQIQIQSSSNGVTSTFEQIDVKDLGTDDTPQFVGIKATNAAFNLATTQTSDQTITIGNSANGGNQITLNGTASITGDLIVQGATTTLNTTNLLVEDKFILLNSGTLVAPNSEGGIIVQTEPNADGGKGTAMYYDSTLNRWLITSASSIAHDASSINGGLTPTNEKAAIVTIQADNSTPSADPLFGSANSNKYGQMYIDTGDNDGDGNNIWIFA